jgi:hypothetical protein
VAPRRLLTLGAAVAALVAVVAVASHGRPLSAGHGNGPTATFFDYLATTLIIFAVLTVGVFLYAIWHERMKGNPPKRGPWHIVSFFVTLAGALLIATLIMHSNFEKRLRNAGNGVKAPRPAKVQQVPKTTPGTRSAHLRWDEIAVVLVLLGGTLVVALATRRARRAPRPWNLGREERVAQAFDESLDDLRSDPDLRRAIIAAYARMERAFASVGLPRHPAEAPFEYVARALRSLDASAEAAEQLTVLFEWAKFSQHEPRAEMRDEAIDALEAVRDELLQPAREAATA